MAKKDERKCPHLKAICIVQMQVVKLGPWDGKGPWALHVDVLDGGSYQVAEGTRLEMLSLQKECKAKLKGDNKPASTVVQIIMQLVPDRLRK